MFIYYFDWSPETSWLPEYEIMWSETELNGVRCNESVWIVPGTMEDSDES